MRDGGLKKARYGWGDAQWVRCLLRKGEDLSVNPPPNHRESQGQQHIPVTQLLERWRQGDLQGSLAKLNC